MSSTLDFLVSMTLVFLAFSVLVSGVMECWNSHNGKRGKFLWQGIARILGTSEEGKRLYGELRTHPAIAALNRDENSSASYIPSSLFAAALVDLLMVRTTRVPLEKFTLAEAIVQLPDNLELKKILLMIWRREQGQIERVEAGLATYFDQCMDRVSGWYKRDAQMRSVLIGLVLAAVLNVDAVHIANALWQDQELARAVANQAQVVDQQHVVGAGDQAVILPAALPLGWPARWFDEWEEVPGKDGKSKGGTTMQLMGHMAGAVLGFVLMGLSCLVGAPVWYQLLAALLPLRAAGSRPERSDDGAAPSGGGGGTQLPAASPARMPPEPNALERQLLVDNKVKEVQVLLKAPTTGKFDAETRLAIQSMQTALGFAPTGQLTEWLLIQLRQNTPQNHPE